MVTFPPQTAPGITNRNDLALYELFDELAELAEKISIRACEPTDPADLALAAAALERTVAALGVGVERAAYALGAPAPEASPPHPTRAVAWRLHGLASALRRCRDLASVVEEAVERLRLQAAPRTAGLSSDTPARRDR